jgi:hypothetical protein
VKNIAIEVENLDLCRKCGGECCKNMGCHFSPDDFSNISFKTLKTELEKGNISIDHWIGDIDEKRDRYSKTYYLRMRNLNTGIVNASWGGQCKIWDKKIGCPLPFEKRPKGARALVPNNLGRCNATYTKEMCVMDWRKHHTILKRLEEYFS